MHDETYMKNVMNDSQNNCTKNNQIELDVPPLVEAQFFAPSATHDTSVNRDILSSVANQFITSTAPLIRALVLRAPTTTYILLIIPWSSPRLTVGSLATLHD